MLAFVLALSSGQDLFKDSPVKNEIALQGLLATLSTILLAAGVFTPLAAFIFFAMLLMIARQAFIAYYV